MNTFEIENEIDKCRQQLNDFKKKTNSIVDELNKNYGGGYEKY